MPKTDAPFSGEIIVASRIVDLLSSGLYASPAACLKELVNNSYDADARQVNVFVKPDADRIIIEDDGTGMTKEEFVSHFSRISESHKREDGDKTRSGRPKIGKIGIGFIAANEICDVMELFSTRKGDTALLHVSIDFAKMRLDPEERRRKGDDLAKGDYRGVVDRTDAASHYTKIFLKSVRGEAKNILASARRVGGSNNALSLYGLQADSVAHALSQPHVLSWADFDSYSQNLLHVALNVPVRYFRNWLPRPLQPRVAKFESHVRKLKFAVSYDGSELFKPTVLRAAGKKAILETFGFKGKHVSAQGYFFAQHGALRPQELNGLLIRIRNSAVGEYDGTFLNFPISEGTLFQRWISAEVWADDRLEDAMNIDRKTLRLAHPAFLELQTIIHEKLSAFLRRTRAELWQRESISRNALKAEQEIHALRTIITEHFPNVKPTTIEHLIDDWLIVEGTASGLRRVLRKYSLSELYDIATESASALLTRDEMRKFVRALTDGTIGR